MKMKSPMTPSEWRERHHKCAYCHWLRYDNMPDKLNLGFSGFYECKVKEKIIRHKYMIRPFCKCYKVREEKELNS